jgi:hypothetical protein
MFHSKAFSFLVLTKLAVTKNFSFIGSQSVLNAARSSDINGLVLASAYSVLIFLKLLYQLYIKFYLGKTKLNWTKIPELESFHFFYFSKNSLKVTKPQRLKVTSSIFAKEPNYNAHNCLQSLYQQLQRLYERNLDSYVDYFYQSRRHHGFAILSKYLKKI